MSIRKRRFIRAHREIKKLKQLLKLAPLPSHNPEQVEIPAGYRTVLKNETLPAGTPQLFFSLFKPDEDELEHTRSVLRLVGAPSLADSTRGWWIVDGDSGKRPSRPETRFPDWTYITPI